MCNKNVLEPCDSGDYALISVRLGHVKECIVSGKEMRLAWNPFQDSLQTFTRGPYYGRRLARRY